jgi:hypothetical protein
LTVNEASSGPRRRRRGDGWALLSHPEIPGKPRLSLSRRRRREVDPPAADVGRLRRGGRRAAASLRGARPRGWRPGSRLPAGHRVYCKHAVTWNDEKIQVIGSLGRRATDSAPRSSPAGTSHARALGEKTVVSLG